MDVPQKPLRRWTRRSVLAATLLPLSYVGYRVADHNNLIITTRGQREFDKGIEPARVIGQSQFSLLVVGDTGKDTFRRTAVVSAMQSHARVSLPDAAVLMGDNFYERGVDSIADQRFETDFESLFDRGAFNFPFYALLGNHDCVGNPEAQVEYTSRSSRWRMPARYYKVRQIAGTKSIDLFAIDTNLLAADDAGASQQLNWLTDELSSSKANWKIVLGHHPVITGGRHRILPEVYQALVPLLGQCGVDLYVSGHDHDLQILDSGNGWMQVISGAGSKLRSTSWIDSTIFAEATPGYCWLLFDNTRLWVSFYSADEHLFTHQLHAKVPAVPLARL